MERFINILIIDENPINQKGLKEILVGNGNNILTSSDIMGAIEILKSKEIGILIINIDNPYYGGIEILQTLKSNSQFKNIYKIALTNNSIAGSNIVKGLNQGAVDFITTPFNPNMVKAKIEVFKEMYFKDLRIQKLIENIFPKSIVNEFNANGFIAPKKVENGIILFTDFVDFSLKSKNLNPFRLLKKLTHYFNQFDEICKRYKLEKVKTIGDSYMVIAGVTDNLPEPAIRVCLAALEIKNLMLTEKEVALAMNKDYWEIRIGIHAGPVVAGIIGNSKLSFDVWGDSVNVASRAEQSSEPGKIVVTKEIVKQIQPYFEIEDKGNVPINKRGGEMNLSFLYDLKAEYKLINSESVNRELRLKCGLDSMDFDNMLIDIQTKLMSLLPENLKYHDYNHTVKVDKSAQKIAKLEGLDDYQLRLLRTAVWYHDAGFIIQYHDNEDFAIEMIKKDLPKFGYSNFEIDLISNIINATKHSVEPKTLLEKIMCDADLDYLGREDYDSIVQNLRNELAAYNEIYEEIDWIKLQIDYLENKHMYYTETALNLRNSYKRNKINELKVKLNQLQ